MNSKTPEKTQNTGTSTSKFANLLDWWPFLLGPASMIVVVFCYKTGNTAFYSKGPHEILALILVPIAAVSFIYGAIVKRRPLVMILSALAVAFFLREWHFAGTSDGIYIALVALGVWCYLWREKIAIDLKYRTMKIWMFAAFWTYFLSQFTARRAFRDLRLPLEDPLHVPWEEVLETTAHLLLIAVSLIAWGYASLKTVKPAENMQDND